MRLSFTVRDQDTPLRSALSSADSDDISSALPGAARDTTARSLLYVWGDFDTSARTAAVRVIWLDEDGSVAEVTESAAINATAVLVAASKYRSEAAVFVNRGYPSAHVLLDSLSGGTVDIYAVTGS